MAPPLCLFFLSVFHIFGTLIQNVYIFPCLIGVLFLFISELFVRPQTNPKLPPFLSEFPGMLLGF